MDWPAPEGLQTDSLIRYRDKAFLIFCGCPRAERRAAWDRVLSYKMEIDRRRPKRCMEP